MNHSIQFIHTFNVNVNPSCCLHFIGCHSAQGYGYSEWTVTADLNLRKIERKKPKEELVARSDPAAMTCMRGDISQSPTASSRVLQGNQQKSEGILVYQGTHTLSLLPPYSSGSHSLSQAKQGTTGIKSCAIQFNEMRLSPCLRVARESTGGI
jgi:hypothetical protein